MLMKNPLSPSCRLMKFWIIFVLLLVNVLPIRNYAKLLDSQRINLFVNHDDLLKPVFEDNDKDYKMKATETEISTTTAEYSNLYRSELNRLSYETIHRILRDEDAPIYRRRQPISELNYYNKPTITSRHSQQQQLGNPLKQMQPSFVHPVAKRYKRSISSEIVINNDYNKLSLINHNLKNSHFMQIAQKHINLIIDLDLSKNFLTWLPIEDFRQLRYLNLSYNEFNRIPLHENSTIITLNLNHNRIKSTIIPINNQLKELFLSANQIENLTDLQFSNLANLEILDLSCNRLKSLESTFFNQLMYNLKHLNLAFNILNIIYRQTFYNLFSLNSLLLAGNNIRNIDYETFLSLPNLQYLDLSHNRLQGESIRALQGISGLVVLSITYNWHLGPHMQEFVASWSLKELDASGTGVCQIPEALTQSVRSLKLNHNPIKMINCGDLDSYPLLHYLDLSFNHIQEIEDDALGRLEMLEILMLDHNDLYKVPMSLPVSLEHLFLQHNQITELRASSFQGLNNLETLDLAGNQLLYLPALSLSKLQTLNLQSAGIRSISHAIVHTLPFLNDLLLEDNPIKCSDLMDIAEWASNCRLTIKEEHYTTDESDENEQNEINATTTLMATTTSPSAHIDLKIKFIKMHNFYENFPTSQCQHQDPTELQVAKNSGNFKCARESNVNSATEANLKAATQPYSLTTKITDKNEETPPVKGKEIFDTLNLQYTNDNSSKIMKSSGYPFSLQTTNTVVQINATGLLLENSTSSNQNIAKNTKNDTLKINQEQQQQQQQVQQHSDLISTIDLVSTMPSLIGNSTASLVYTTETSEVLENCSIPQIHGGKIPNVKSPRHSSSQQKIMHLGQITANILQLPTMTITPWPAINKVSMALTTHAINSFKERKVQMKPLNSSKETSSATAIDTTAALNSASDRNAVNGHNDDNNNKEKGYMQNIYKLNGKPINSNTNGNIDYNDGDGSTASNGIEVNQENRLEKQKFQLYAANYYNNKSKQNVNRHQSHTANIDAIEQRTIADNYTDQNHREIREGKRDECIIMVTSDQQKTNSFMKSMQGYMNNISSNSNYVGNNGNQVIITSIQYAAMNATVTRYSNRSDNNNITNSNSSNSRSAYKENKKNTETASNVKCSTLNHNGKCQVIGSQKQIENYHILTLVHRSVHGS